METKISEIADGIYRLSTYVPEIAPPAGFTFNQFLVLGDEPLMFHTGLRKMFALNRDALARIIPPERLRWITFGHFEADECGAMNEWLAAAPQATPAHGATGCMVSLNDFADRASRVLNDGETIDLGGKRVRFIDTPHTPHGWDAGVLYEESTRHADVRRPVHPARRRPRADRRRRGRAGDRRGGCFQVFEPRARHGHDDPRPRAARAAHARADARAVLRRRRRRRAARARRRLRPARVRRGPRTAAQRGLTRTHRGVDRSVSSQETAPSTPPAVGGKSSLPDGPCVDDFGRVRELELHVEAPRIERQQRVMRFIRRAADAVARHDHAESAIDRRKHGSEHADVGLRTGDDERVAAALHEMREQARRRECRICRLVEDACRRHVRRERGQQLEQGGIDPFARHRRPFAVIGLPSARRIRRSQRRDEAREQGFSPVRARPWPELPEARAPSTASARDLAPRTGAACRRKDGPRSHRAALSTGSRLRSAAAPSNPGLGDIVPARAFSAGLRRL